MIAAIVWTCLSLGVCLEPPNPKAQQQAIDQLYHDMWDSPRCRNKLFSSCVPWSTDA